MTQDNIAFHITFIKNMSEYDCKSFLKYAHKDHVYFTVDTLNKAFRVQLKKFK